MNKIKIKIKPLSVNKAWQGRRFKTQEYKAYEEELLYILPKIEIPKSKKLQVCIEYGFSNKCSDIDNPCKPFLDVLQKKYGFNDSRIYRLIQNKKISEKGGEYISYRISEL